jgi:hypothetical protein
MVDSGHVERLENDNSPLPLPFRVSPPPPAQVAWVIFFDECHVLSTTHQNFRVGFPTHARGKKMIEDVEN